MQRFSVVSGKQSPVHDGTPQRHFVGVFQFIADGDTPGNDAQFHIKPGKFTEDVKIGRIAFHRGAECQDYFPDAASLHTFDEAVILQVRRADAVHRGNDSSLNMVKSLELLRILHRHNILNVLYDADGRCIALRIATQPADLRIGYVVTHLAVFHFMLKCYQGVAERLHHGSVLPQQIEHQPHRCLPSDARQLGKFIERLLQEGGSVLLVYHKSETIISFFGAQRYGLQGNLLNSTGFVYFIPINHRAVQSPVLFQKTILK